jgi:hypothetical protein
MKLPSKPPLPADRSRPPAWFWDIVEHCEGDPERLRALMQDATPSALLAFAFVWRWAVAEIPSSIAEGLTTDPSEDVVRDVAEWIVAQGRAVYERARDEGAAPLTELPRAPPFLSVVETIHHDRYGRFIPPNPD